MKKIFIDDQLIKDYTLSIIRQLDNDRFRPDLIIGMVRGGSIPAILLSQYYDIPCYMQNKQQETEYFDESISCVLVVDEINDTGKTLVDFNNALYDTQREDLNIRYAALVTNAASIFTVDYSGVEINKLEDPSWIVFPWEQWWLQSTKNHPLRP